MATLGIIFGFLCYFLYPIASQDNQFPVNHLNINSPAAPSSNVYTLKIKEDDKKKKKKKKKVKKSDIFYPDTVRSYNIIIKKNFLLELDDNPAKEEYVPCSIVVDYQSEDSKLYEGCGCRYKGSVGSLRLCIDPTTGKDNNYCRKFSWKVDANKFLSKGNDQKIRGLKKLVFNGLAVDDSLMSERVSYTVIEEAGMPGPKVAHGAVYLNSEFDGVYSLVENPDDEFTERMFEDDVIEGEGALYKDALLRKGYDIDYYKKHRSTDTNEDEFMMMVGNAAGEATEETALEFFETYFDVESIVNMTAINTVLGMSDDWRRRHNFFWYVRHDEIETINDEMIVAKKLVMIPWDYDRINDDHGSKNRAPPGSPDKWYYPMEDAEHYCRERDDSPESLAKMHPFNQRDYWVEFYSYLPPDLNKPINCDHFTKLMAAALKDRVIDRTHYFATELMTPKYVKHLIDRFYMQIESFVGLNNSKPSKFTFNEAIDEIEAYFIETAKEGAKKEKEAEKKENGSITLPPFATTPSTSIASNSSSKPSSSSSTSSSQRYSSSSSNQSTSSSARYPSSSESSNSSRYPSSSESYNSSRYPSSSESSSSRYPTSSESQSSSSTSTSSSSQSQYDLWKMQVQQQQRQFSPFNSFRGGLFG